MQRIFRSGEKACRPLMHRPTPMHHIKPAQ